jgi:flagellar biosynthesis/type III secretory pathway M-ring protein FliF/YscJ
MTDRRRPQVREDDDKAAKERIDTHVKNDAKRWWYLVWSIIVAYILIGVVSFAFLSLLGDVRDNTAKAQEAADKANHAAKVVNATALKAQVAARNSTIAICFEVAYLDNVIKQSKKLIKQDPDPERRKTRRDQLALTKDLLDRLKDSVGGTCPKPPKPKTP